MVLYGRYLPSGMVTTYRYLFRYVASGDTQGRFRFRFRFGKGA